jgi:hypothetical protein
MDGEFVGVTTGDVEGVKLGNIDGELDEGNTVEGDPVDCIAVGFSEQLGCIVGKRVGLVVVGLVDVGNIVDCVGVMVGGIDGRNVEIVGFIEGFRLEGNPVGTTLDGVLVEGAIVGTSVGNVLGF